ncbi:hypothetical protein [Brucella pituitosa]|uniref:Uncharacterized protein n=1 Tax=Brucella pituitosa TaxID=571256 RepID=A0A643EXU2_9HYPH|nr:hypothetical protein [Brucella pituitosa]KAB0568792.1 hypothetical protein F7Q93_18560 [Brucella pituitosa]
MPSTFKIKDGLSQLGIRKPFGVNEEGVHAFECLRILCGTVNLHNKSDGSVIKLRNCFLTQAVRKLKVNSLKEIINSAFDGDMSLDDVDKYLSKTSGVNKDFWMKVKGELCLTLACWSKNQYTRAFLHIYRLIEMTSVALPLFYASVEHNYLKSLEFLKGLPQNPRDGDLAIFRKFVSILAKEGGYEKLKMEVFYSKGDLTWDARYTKQIYDYVISAERLTASIDTAASKIDIPFSEFPSFFVTFRNRLFHSMLSAENLDLDQLGGSDAACEPLINPALNWFTMMLCVILKQNAARYI